MEFNSKNYSVEIVTLKAGTYFLGTEVLSDTYYYIAKDFKNQSIVESYESNLDSTISNQILRIAKNLKIENLQVDDDLNLETCFEYPEASGNTYSISRNQFSYFNSLYLFKNSFSYPFEYLGNEGVKLILNNSTDLDTFVNSALTKHQEVYKNRYLVKVNEVNEETITVSLKASVINIMNVTY